LHARQPLTPANTVYLPSRRPMAFARILQSGPARQQQLTHA
jgi:hypothetical protein